MREQTKAGETPERITVSMIDQDLKDGISKADMAIKYNIKPWEVDEMFKHPFLKGRRPSRKKALSFSFIDDTEPTENGTIAPAEKLKPRGFVGDDTVVEQEVEVDPNQITLHDAIDDAIESATQAQEALTEAVEAVEEIFPTQQEDSDLSADPEGMYQEAADTLGDPDEDYDLGEPPTVEDTLDLVKEQQEEEELEMDDDTFEL